MYGLGYTCDYDDQEITGELYEVRVPRPSDPSDMSCVMWSCASHAEQLGAKAASWWDRWIENEGRARGYLFLS